LRERSTHRNTQKKLQVFEVTDGTPRPKSAEDGVSLIAFSIVGLDALFGCSHLLTKSIKLWEFFPEVLYNDAEIGVAAYFIGPKLMSCLKQTNALLVVAVGNF
jgi:hypothetical protein